MVSKIKKPATKNTINARMELRIPPVMPSMIPNENIPITIPIFSHTSKKLKKDAWSSVSGNNFE